MPPRRLDRIRVPGQISKPLQQLLEWHGAGCWADRAAAWDSHLDALRQAEQEAAVRQSAQDIQAQHIQIIKEARELALDQLGKMQAAALEGDSHFMKPNELTRLIESVVKLDRLVRGESTENTKEQVDMSSLSLDELRALAALREKIK